MTAQALLLRNTEGVLENISTSLELYQTRKSSGAIQASYWIQYHNSCRVLTQHQAVLTGITNMLERYAGLDLAPLDYAASAITEADKAIWKTNEALAYGNAIYNAIKETEHEIEKKHKDDSAGVDGKPEPSSPADGSAGGLAPRRKRKPSE